MKAAVSEFNLNQIPNKGITSSVSAFEILSHSNANLNTNADESFEEEAEEFEVERIERPKTYK